MYHSIQENKDFAVIRKYESTRLPPDTKQNPTKKGSYLDDTIKMNCSPGPASTTFVIQTRPTNSLTGPKSRFTRISTLIAKPMSMNCSIKVGKPTHHRRASTLWGCHGQSRTARICKNRTRSILSTIPNINQLSLLAQEHI